MAEVMSGGSDRPPRRWTGVVAALVLAAGVVGYLASHNSGSGHPSAHPSPPLAPTRSERPQPPGLSGPSPTTAEIGHRILGVTARWELFGRGDGFVVRIQPARGLVTRTGVPILDSGGPVSFYAGPAQVIVRPLDTVTGYVVPDGQPAQDAPGDLANGGPLLAGPDPGHVWVPVGDGDRATMTLVGMDGRPTRTFVPLPEDLNGFTRSDQLGYLLFTGTGGVYDVRPTGPRGESEQKSAVRRVTAGALLAAGPTRWLTRECDERGRCTTVVTDRRTGHRRSLGHLAALPGAMEGGVIAPDGSYAAVLRPDSQSGEVTVQLVSLASGAEHAVDVPLDQQSIQAGTIVWSPDSRWLFVAGAHGELSVVDARTAAVRDLGVQIPPVVQLAIRNPVR
ncbi:MAG TPA: hypothetical protein VHX59_00415 [Mycobacteriales bacterium]|jgi:hypothetical protein|nr:hypothetical protein [Mycobacteriales bacterium]